MAVISIDPPVQSRGIVTKHHFEFPLLADEQGKVVDQFGLRHIAGGPAGQDIARPATFILNREGRIVWRAVAENVRLRVRPGTILQQLDTIP